MINAALAKNVLDDLMVTNTRGAMQALHVLDIGGIDDTAACIVAPPDLWDRPPFPPTLPLLAVRRPRRRLSAQSRGSVLQILMEADVEGLIGAARYERCGECTTYRNGYRERALDTRLGFLNLKIPSCAPAAYFPGFLEPRRTVEKALVAVIQEAWIAGVSPRRSMISSKPWG